MAREELSVVHTVEVVARKYEKGVNAPVADVRQDLSDGVRSPLEPLRVLRRLLGGEYLDEAVGELREAVGRSDVLVQGGGVVLRQNEYAEHVRVDAVRDRYVNEAVLAAERHSRLRPRQRERREARARAAAQNNRENVRPLRSHRFLTFRLY